MALKPEAFQRCFQDWIADAIPTDDSEPGPPRRHRRQDLSRLARRAPRASAPLHIVSAWASEEGIALGQVATEDKSNEITAIPQLLEQIDLTDTLITIDAMGCQKEIVEQIVAGGGDFVIAVKDNQPKLLSRDRGVLPRAPGTRPGGPPAIGTTRRARTGTAASTSGPIISPRCRATSRREKEWPWVKAIGYAVRITRHADGTETDEVRYYICSRYLSGKRFGEAVRGHWGIESMHWVLDVNFREDDSRTRERTLGNNLSWLRRFAVTLLKRHPDQGQPPRQDDVLHDQHRLPHRSPFTTACLICAGRAERRGVG